MKRAAIMLVTMLCAAIAAAQMTAQQFEGLKNDAVRLLNERRLGEAIESLKTAYASRPDPGVRGLMVMPYFASGLFPEGEDALKSAVAEGALVSFIVRHNHSRGYCFGWLTVGLDKISFAGADGADSFEVSRSEIPKVQVWTNEMDGQPTRAGSPIIRVRTKKNWNFTYALYGAGQQYELSIIGDIVYRDQELANAERASAIIAEVIQQVPEAPKHEERDINITAGMSKAEVTGKLGQPTKAIVFGDKTILKYPEMTIELVGDRVVDVKAN